MQIEIEEEKGIVSALRAQGYCRPWLRLLSEVLKLAGPNAELVKHSERPWASVTFSGTRHAITVNFSGPDATSAGEAFVTALPDHEFTIRGQLVADATIASVEQELLPEPRMTVDAELLLLEDC